MLLERKKQEDVVNGPLLGFKDSDSESDRSVTNFKEEMQTRN